MMRRILGRRTVMSWIAWMIVSCLTVIGCGTSLSSDLPSTAEGGSGVAITLTVSAAASMQDALNSIQSFYEETHPGTTLRFNFASSGSLQQQIEQGAPVDVFLSASPKHMDTLEEKGLLLDGTRQDLVENTIVLVTPLDEANVNTFHDLNKNTITTLAIGEPDSVPAGYYSKEVLESLEIYESVKPKTIYAKDVRQVLSYVETGNVDAGLVYSTDAKISDQTQVVATAPDYTHSSIVYPGAVTLDSRYPEAAAAFVEFLGTEAAIAIFTDYGFLATSSG